MKTIDKKNVYKVADASQIMICSHDLQPITETSLQSDVSKSKRDKMWQWPHGRELFFHTFFLLVNILRKKSGRNMLKQIINSLLIIVQFVSVTPPMKSVRKRRFRKTKKKKYMDAPEVERELKRLLRADIEATSSRWEVGLTVHFRLLL